MQLAMRLVSQILTALHYSLQLIFFQCTLKIILKFKSALVSILLEVVETPSYLEQLDQSFQRYRGGKQYFEYASID